MNRLISIVTIATSLMLISCKKDKAPAKLTSFEVPELVQVYGGHPFVLPIVKEPVVSDLSSLEFLHPDETNFKVELVNNEVILTYIPLEENDDTEGGKIRTENLRIGNGELGYKDVTVNVANRPIIAGIIVPLGAPRIEDGAVLKTDGQSNGGDEYRFGFLSMPNYSDSDGNPLVLSSDNYSCSVDAPDGKLAKLEENASETLHTLSFYYSRAVEGLMSVTYSYIDRYSVAGKDSDKEYTLSFSIDSYHEKVSVTAVEFDHSTMLREMGGEPFRVGVKVYPEDAGNQNVTFSSSDPSVATVDETGLISLVGPGEVTLTVTTEDGGFSDDCLLTVAPAISKVQVRSIGREYAAHLCQIMASYNFTFEYVVTPSDVPFVHRELSVENPSYWLVKDESEKGFTITSNTEEGETCEFNIYYCSNHKAYFELKQLENQEYAQSFFDTYAFKLDDSKIFFVEDGVLYQIVLTYNKVLDDYVLNYIDESYLSFKGSVGNGCEFEITDIYDRKTRECKTSLGAKTQIIIDDIDSSNPVIKIDGTSYNASKMDLSSERSRIVRYLNSYCD